MSDEDEALQSDIQDSGLAALTTALTSYLSGTPISMAGITGLTAGVVTFAYQTLILRLGRPPLLPGDDLVAAEVVGAVVETVRDLEFEGVSSAANVRKITEEFVDAYLASSSEEQVRALQVAFRRQFTGEGNHAVRRHWWSVARELTPIQVVVLNLINDGILTDLGQERLGWSPRHGGSPQPVGLSPTDYRAVFGQIYRGGDMRPSMPRLVQQYDGHSQGTDAVARRHWKLTREGLVLLEFIAGG